MRSTARLRDGAPDREGSPPGGRRGPGGVFEIVASPAVGFSDRTPEFGSIEALLERASEVKRKSYREGLQEHRDQALLSKELVTIHTDLPIEFEPDSLQVEEPDLEVLRELYREMGFRRLLDEEPDLDPERIGCYGGSYGGFATAWCSTKLTEHFAASVRLAAEPPEAAMPRAMLRRSSLTERATEESTRG